MKRLTQKILLVLLSLGMAISLSAQNKVTGVVTDENGEPLMGAGVFVEGTTVGVVTGLDGDYEIVLPEGSVAPVKEDFLWDFSDADWQAELASKGAKNADITNWVSELNGLTFTSTAKSKWNTATINEVVYYYIQAGGKGNNADGTLDRTFTFTTTTAGIVSVTASNTGGSAATDARRVAVVGSDGVTQYGDTPAPASNEPKVYDFEVPAGLVTIYPDTNGLRFYKIEYHSK